MCLILILPFILRWLRGEQSPSCTNRNTFPRPLGVGNRSTTDEDGNERHQRNQVLAQKQVEQLTYRRSDAFIVLSEYFRDVLTETYGVAERKIHIIPGAVDHNRFRPHPDRNELRLQLGIAPINLYSSVSGDWFAEWGLTD